MEPGNQTMAALLHSRECPFGYQCVAMDCVECVKKYMEKGAANGKS